MATEAELKKLITNNKGVFGMFISAMKSGPQACMRFGLVPRLVLLTSLFPQIIHLKRDSG